MFLVEFLFERKQEGHTALANWLDNVYASPREASVCAKLNTSIRILSLGKSTWRGSGFWRSSWLCGWDGSSKSEDGSKAEEARELHFGLRCLRWVVGKVLKCYLAELMS
jgi:hypothetical protein